MKDFIISSIRNIPETIKGMKQVKSDMLNYYLDNESKFEKYREVLLKHDFLNEALNILLHKQKDKLIDKVYENVLKLEAHSFAPELNKLHFKNCVVGTPQKTTINSAVLHLIKTLSLEQINELI